MDPATRKAVLAYSGGLDTSVTIRWLIEQGYEVHAVAVDVGQREDFDEIVERGRKAGAASVRVAEAVERWDRVRTAHMSYRNDQEHSVRVRNAAAASHKLLQLVDHPNVLPTLLELLGPDVHVLGSEAFVRRAGDAPLEGWHTDGGASLMGLNLDPTGRALVELDLDDRLELHIHPAP